MKVSKVIVSLITLLSLVTSSWGTMRDIYDETAAKIEPRLVIFGCDRFTTYKTNYAYSCLLDDNASLLWISGESVQTFYITLTSPAETTEQRQLAFRGGAVLAAMTRGGGISGNHVGLSMDLVKQSFHDEGKKKCSPISGGTKLSKKPAQLCVTLPNNAAVVWALSFLDKK